MRIARILDSNGDETYAIKRDGTLFRASGDPFADGLSATDVPVEAAAWLPPVEPRAILCIGKNYLAHAQEFDGAAPEYPVLFMKNPAAATGHQQPVRIPKVCGDEVDYEGELAIVIGKSTRDASTSEALASILGFTCANDISARIWQKDKGGSQWCRGKGFDTFAPMGPVLVTPDEFGDPTAVTLRTRVNGEELQVGHTRDMLYPIVELVAFLSQDTTLLPGTVILTGTPEGVGWARTPKITLKPGDCVEVEIDGIGILQSPVEASP